MPFEPAANREIPSLTLHNEMLHNSATQGDNAMSLLSTYLLQGWVMTDEHCRVPDCPVPIMRSKDGSIRFCVTHDTLPTGSSKSTAPAQPSQSQQQQPQRQEEEVVAKDPYAASGRRYDDDAARIQLERREQSSRASQLIGQKMLQRWTLLNETCPNPECYAVPLMRDLSKRMVCVICERTYLTEEQAAEAGANIKQQEQSTPAVAKEKQEPNKQQLEHHVSKPVVEDHSSLCEQEHPVVPSSTLPETASSVTEPLVQKIHELSQRVSGTKDAIELKHLFEAIEAGANAVKACRLVNM